MKARSLLVLLLMLAVAGTCVRLGFWQLSRWHQKQALNAAVRRALAARAIPIGRDPAPLDSVRARRAEVRGRYDETRQVLLSGRSHAGSPGVEVVTPLRLEGGAAVLVNRGWLYAPDAATARPQEYSEAGGRTVLGIAEPIARGRDGAPLAILESDSVTLWSARGLDLDSLAARMPYPLAPYVLRQLPGEGVPARPVRSAPRPLDETMHLSYAIQWFFFAAIALGGPAAFTWSRRRRSGREPDSDLVIPRS